MSLLKQFSNLHKIARTYSSALYITGDKAQHNFALVTPILDFEDRLQNKVELQKNITLRDLSIDLDKIERRWYFFKYLDEQKIALVAAKLEISKQLAELHKSGSNNAEIEKLQLHSKVIKDDLKILKNYLYGVEESAALHVLSLPNNLHKNTPTSNEDVIFQHLDKPTSITNSHMVLGKNLIKYTNPFFYFFKGDAALFEYSVINYFSNALSSFLRFSNSDFCKSVVVEGCGTNFEDSSRVFTLEDLSDDRDYTHTHLTGGGSLYSFMAYFTKHLILENLLPMRIFTSGRNYNPNKFKSVDLFSVNQATVLDFFIATKDDEEEMNKEFNEMVTLIKNVYEPLGYHFRLVYLPAKELKFYESLRVSIQMFSNYLQKYVEVGHCSICDNFLSKRLLFTYTSNKDRKFVRIISGTLLRVPVMLACVVENNVNNDMNLLSDVLKKFIQ